MAGWIALALIGGLVVGVLIGGSLRTVVVEPDQKALEAAALHLAADIMPLVAGDPRAGMVGDHWKVTVFVDWSLTGQFPERLR